MENDKGKWLAFGLLLVALTGVFAVGYKMVYRPHKQQQETTAKEEAKKDTLQATSSQSHYLHTVRLALDSFSGYAILRSSEFRNNLANRGIKLEISDDGADYPARLRALKDNTVDLAAFTVDALVKNSAEINDLPAAGVLLIDETKKADAVLAYKGKYPNIDALNNPRTRFVLVKDSPSEMILLLMRASFKLDKLAADCMIYVKDGEEVFARFRQAKQTDDLAFITWEPYIQKMLDNPNLAVLVDSSNFRGYVVDWLVANRQFLKDNRAVVKDVVQSYFRAGYELHSRMVKLVIDDASAMNTPLSDKQARALVQGVWWKNVQENYGHMGVDRGTSLLNMEDIIQNITNVLVRSGAIQKDPTNGQANLLYYNQILQELKDENFHPGNDTESTGTVRNEMTLKPLDDAGWDGLQSVGTLQVDDITFRRGTADIRDEGIVVLDKLAQALKTWTSYYVSVRGDAATAGDQQANMELAKRRAEVAAEYLTSKGIDKNRVRAVSGMPAGTTRVSFVLGQVPY